MGGLAHYFERAGIATTQISLVRLHTETMRPPRALWVPFELGRPFGPPDDSAFQARVVAAALALLERTDTPVLEDFPDDMPVASADSAGWACPVNFVPPPVELSGDAALAAALQEELDRLLPWYSRVLDRYGRTTVGVSTLPVDALGPFFVTLLTDERPDPIAGFDLSDSVRLAAEDLKAVYLEAAGAQPGAPDGARLAAWFWSDTEAAAVLRALKARFEQSEDARLKLLGDVFLVPRAAIDGAAGDAR